MSDTELAVRRRRARANYPARTLARALERDPQSTPEEQRRRLQVALVSMKRLRDRDFLEQLVAAQMTALHDWAMGTLGRAGATSDDRTAQGYLHHSTRLLNTFIRLAAMRTRSSAATAAPELQATLWSPEEPEWSKRIHEGRWQEDEEIRAWLRHQAVNDPAFRARILAAAADAEAQP